MSDIARQKCPGCGALLRIDIECDHEPEIANLRSELHAARDALSNYGEHRWYRNCELEYDSDGIQTNPCSCGLDKAISRISALLK